MARNRSLSAAPTGQETVSGFVYLAFQLLLLPSFLFWCNAQLAQPLQEAELNFVFYMINFIAMLLIFHGFLGRSLAQATRHPLMLCEALILGFVAYYACRYVTEHLIRLLLPSFSNYNDAAIAAMKRGNGFLMLVGTVVLVPPFEECIYRGLIFRKLYNKNHTAAYLVSIFAFAAIHILGYIGQYSPLELLLACLQYLPAGLCLAWSYVRADTIFAPILIHAAINYLTITGMR
ncbi:MAG: CPBP family intramembrane metalloprotease [Oscillospiraceae bacterium]|nr:CPBP family intramembrane metalloprotease [Oscillospiraceae bacterium]